MTRYFQSKLNLDLELPCSVFRLDSDGRVFWRHSNTGSPWFEACSIDCYQTADDILRGVERGYLVEIGNEPVVLRW